MVALGDLNGSVIGQPTSRITHHASGIKTKEVRRDHTLGAGIAGAWVLRAGASRPGLARARPGAAGAALPADRAAHRRAPVSGRPGRAGAPREAGGFPHLRPGAARAARPARDG